MATERDNYDLYEVILIESDDDFAVICPGIPGAVSQGKDREEALSDDRRRHGNVPAVPPAWRGKRSPARQEELRRDWGKAKIAELVAECEEEGLEHYVCKVAPQLIQPDWQPTSVAVE